MPSTGQRDGDQSAVALLLYNETVARSERLAGLAPATPFDLECVERAMHELLFGVIVPKEGNVPSARIPEPLRTALARAANDPTLDAYVATVALLTSKVASARRLSEPLDQVRDGLDGITFDERRTKAETLALLRTLRAELDDRIGYAKGLQGPRYRFDAPPELYADRKSRHERPDQFFRRVYGAHARRGLTQADIRKADPAFYNVLHVWCVRNQRKMASLVAPTRNFRPKS